MTFPVRPPTIAATLMFLTGFDSSEYVERFVTRPTKQMT